MNETLRTAAISPLRQRMIDDMNVRRFSRETQRNYVRDVGRFATFLRRSPDTATPDDVRQFQIEQREAGVPTPTMNIRRFLLHVLPRGFHRIRHYGLLAASARKASLARARELLAVASTPDDDTPEEPRDVRPPCPCCGGSMIVVEVFARWSQTRAPPHTSRSAEEVSP
jgi:integrase-like protein/putative transposase